ncbi:hypothetical protein OK016_14455 [Vibrio chagasii]|nr:hypothetical protein [Vibrio chagasii]
MHAHGSAHIEEDKYLQVSRLALLMSSSYARRYRTGLISGANHSKVDVKASTFLLSKVKADLYYIPSSLWEMKR